MSDGCCDNVTCNRHCLLEHDGRGRPSCFRRFWLFFVNLFISPFVLALQSVLIYLIPCLEAYLMKACCFVLCKICFCEYWMYKDKRFTPPMLIQQAMMTLMPYKMRPAMMQ